MITDASEKATIFNTFFCKTVHCNQTGSDLPDFQCLTNHRLDKINFDPTIILSIIHSLNVNKAHGWDEVSCDETLIPPLQIIFQISSDG